MKNKDITSIIFIVVLSAGFSLLLSTLLFGSSKTKLEKVEKVDKISADFPLPESKYFNSNSINPTRNISINENNNQTPFGN